VYSLSVWTKSTAAGEELYVKNYGGPDKVVPVPEGSSWTNVTVGDIAVSDGHAEFGVASGGQTVKVDDFTLVGR
jgi:hypothetical protein